MFKIFRQSKAMLVMFALLLVCNPIATVSTMATGTQRVPPVVTGVSASQNGDNHISVEWNGLADIIGFSVYKSKAGSPFENIATLTHNFFSDFDVLPSTVFKYYITAHNSDGESAASQVVEIRTQDIDTTPSEPLQVINLIATRVSSYSTELLWMLASSKPAKRYEVLRNNTLLVKGVYAYQIGAISASKILGSTTQTTFVDNTVLPGATYAYHIRAYDNSDIAYVSSAATVVTNPI